MVIAIFFPISGCIPLIIYTSWVYGDIPCIVRKNALIVIIAMCLAALVSYFQKKDRKLLIGMLLTLILPLLTYQGIYKMYELRYREQNLRLHGE